MGYDLTIGYCLKVNRRRGRIEKAWEVNPADPELISLEPDTYLVVVTREFVYLSSRVAATFHSKSSLAAQAIFLNSTTADPNWEGRLIFLLYNASGADAELESNKTCATMVVHNVERRSQAFPTNPRVVLTRYVGQFAGDASGALRFVMEVGLDAHEFQRLRDQAKRYSSRPTPVFVAQTLWRRYVTQKALRIAVPLAVAIAGVAVAIRPPIWLLGVAFGSERYITLVGSLASIVSLGLAVLAVSQARRDGRLREEAQEKKRLG
ncbi:MAG TPA: hypothetical protein VGS57_19120 [Thermoanaerobaculia bacterium]|nr:hypothetical protein [Thermoanaerobaculia bacterium]